MTGAFTDDKMREVLDRFINKYVCCKKCTFPELIMKNYEGKIIGDCKSCGHVQLLDNKHKIAQTLIKELKPTKDIKGLKISDVKTKGGKNTTGLNTKEAVKSKKKKSKVLADVEMRAFRDRLKDENYTLDTTHPVMIELVNTYREMYNKVKGEDKKKKYVREKCYKNLKTLKIPRDKQIIYGYLYINTVFDKNLANQVDKNAKFLIKSYEVI